MVFFNKISLSSFMFVYIILINFKNNFEKKPSEVLAK